MNSSLLADFNGPVSGPAVVDLKILLRRINLEKRGRRNTDALIGKRNVSFDVVVAEENSKFNLMILQ